MPAIAIAIRSGRAKITLPILTDSDCYSEKKIILNVSDIAKYIQEKYKQGEDKDTAAESYTKVADANIRATLYVECSEPRYTFAELESVIKYIVRECKI